MIDAGVCRASGFVAGCNDQVANGFIPIAVRITEMANGAAEQILQFPPAG